MHMLSATQIESFIDCKRKWAWRSIEKVPTQQNIYAAVGDETHKQIENYLLYGKPPDIGQALRILDDKTGRIKTFYPGRMVLAAVGHLPAPGTKGLLVEKSFEMQSRAGLITGRLDLQYVDTDGAFVIHDNKTTGDFKWALKPEDLETNVQSVIYAAYAMQFRKLSTVRAKWLYLLRDSDKPKSRLVERDLTLSTIDKQLSPLLDIGEEMQQLYASKVRALDLPPTISSCEKYGGCPYKSVCKLTPEQQWSGLMAQESMLDKLRAKRAEVAANPVPPPSPPKVSSITTPNMMARMKQDLVAKGVNPPESKLVYEDDSEVLEEEPTPPPVKRSPGRPKATPTSAPVKEVKEVASQAEGSTFTLLINCAPQKLPGTNEIISIEDVLSPLAHELAQENGVAHYRLLSTDYGTAQGYLMQKVDEFLRAGGLQGQTVVAFNGGLLTKDTIEVFAAHAATVIRGAL